MKIVFLNPAGQLGGAERSLLNMLASLRAAEPDWTFHLVTGAAGPLVAQAESLGVPTNVLPFPTSLAGLGDSALGAGGGLKAKLSAARTSFAAAPALLIYVRRLRRALRILAPDVIHSNGFKMHVLGVMTAPRTVPVIWHIHDYVTSRPVMAHLLRRLAGRCSAAIAVSKSVATDLRTACGEHLPIYPIYNGIDLAEFSPAGPQLDLDALAGLSAAARGTIRVGLVATLARWKGHETFLRALSLLPTDVPVRGYIVGGAIYQTAGSQYSLDELRALAAQFGVADKVGFTGFMAETAAAMRALDVVVHASTQPEPFGLVIAEAMACGRAVIVGLAGGAAELVDEGRDALGHRPGDAAALAERLARLATNAALRAALGKAGRATAAGRFDRARLAAELLPLYHSVRRTIQYQ